MLRWTIREISPALAFDLITKVTVISQVFRSCPQICHKPLVPDNSAMVPDDREADIANTVNYHTRVENFSAKIQIPRYCFLYDIIHPTHPRPYIEGHLLYEGMDSSP